MSAEKVVSFVTNPALYKKLRSDKAANLEMLWKEHQIGEEDIEYLYLYARFQFDCGNYSGAAEFLKYYRLLCNNGERAVSALWGKFAADMLMADWDESLEDLNRIKEVIDNKASHWTPLTQLTNRTWFVHWSLFVFFNHESGRNHIIDVFFQARRSPAAPRACRIPRRLAQPGPPPCAAEREKSTGPPLNFVPPPLSLPPSYRRTAT